MADDAWMIEQHYARRVRGLMSDFERCASSASASLTSQDLAVLDGEATNVVRLLREVKTNLVRDHAAKRYPDEVVARVKLTIDHGIERVMAKRSEWRAIENGETSHSDLSNSPQEQITEKLISLGEMVRSGLLSEREFLDAKTALLKPDSSLPETHEPQSAGSGWVPVADDHL